MEGTDPCPSSWFRSAAPRRTGRFCQASDTAAIAIGNPRVNARAASARQCRRHPASSRPYGRGASLLSSIKALAADVDRGHPGAPLLLLSDKVSANNLLPISRARVDVWHTPREGGVLFRLSRARRQSKNIATPSGGTFMRGTAIPARAAMRIPPPLSGWSRAAPRMFISFQDLHDDRDMLHRPDVFPPRSGSVHLHLHQWRLRIAQGAHTSTAMTTSRCRIRPGRVPGTSMEGRPLSLRRWARVTAPRPSVMDDSQHRRPIPPPRSSRVWPRVEQNHG